MENLSIEELINIFSKKIKKPVFEATLLIVDPDKLKEIGKCTSEYCILTEQKDLKAILQELFSSEELSEEDQQTFKDTLYIIENLTVQIADVPNGNNRIYPKEVLEKAVKEAQKVVETQQMIGELDHISAEILESPYPLVSRASHLILRLWMEGNKVKADILILPTKYGKHLIDLLKAGAKIGISVRALGEVDESGRVSDLQILTYDFVSFPSYSELLVDKSMLRKIKLG